jgi:hypothetical protein
MEEDELAAINQTTGLASTGKARKAQESLVAAINGTQNGIECNAK